MEFIIYELSDTIFDPETKEDLGQLELHKGRVKVINAQENVSQAVTFLKKVHHDPIWGRMTDSWRSDSGLEQLPIDPKEVTATATVLKVRVGDLIRSIDR